MNHPSLWLEKEFTSLKTLIGNDKTSHYRQGRIVYKQGDVLRDFFLVEQGIVKISIISEDGHEKIIGFQSEHSLFGMDCFCKPCCASVTATALTDTYIYRVSHVIIENIINKEPRIGIDLARYYSKLLRLMCLQTEYQAFHDALMRVVSYFLLYAKENDYDEHPIINLTMEEIASLVATSRVNVSRVLKKLCSMNIIEKKRGRIIIKDRNRLLSVGHLPYFDDSFVI